MPAPAYRSHATIDTEGQPTIAVTKPSGVVDGDLLLAALSFYMPNSGTDVTTVPSGWTLLRTVNGFAALSHRLNVYWKIAASEPSSWTFTTNNAVGHVAISACMAISDPVATGGYITDHTGQVDSSSSSSHPAAAVTAGSVDDLLVYLGEVRANGSGVVWTPPSGYTERWDFKDPGGFDLSMTAATKTAGTAGSTGTVTGTTGIFSVQASAVLIAVNGNAGPPPSTFVPQIIIS